MLHPGASQLKNITVSYTERPFDTGPLAKHIHDFFTEKNEMRAIKGLPPFTNGSLLVFNPGSESVDEGNIHVVTQQSDYAHFLYLQEHNAPLAYIAATISPIAFLRTREGDLVFGEQAGHVHSPGAIGAVGGALTLEDVTDNGVDITENMRKKIGGETGIPLSAISSMHPFSTYLYADRRCLGVGYDAQLDLTREEVANIFAARSDDELSRLHFVPFDELDTFYQQSGPQLRSYMREMAQFL